MQILLSEVEERHAALVGLLQRAACRQNTAAIPGEVRDNTDRFLAAASRHGAATARVLLPAVKRHLHGGRAEVRDFIRLSRRLERMLVRAKAKQYGGAQTVHHSWTSVWNGVRSRLTQTLAAERRLVAMLRRHLGPEDERRLRNHFTLAIAAAPTRPHPCLPRTGPAGHLTRLICARFDAVWDELEGRVTSPALVSRVQEHAAPVDVVGRQRHKVLFAQRPPQLDQPASLPQT
ncbi:hypothetical protein EV644_101126 [Kribbella orskensis]|uniref:Hemerythrin HHE cation binding domain-containing protein n=1 Tax=Kribbella orskensis TaxID=2512216 RepID=A0ABY2BTA0_9ACTN|nr:hypothetical protein EV642_101863 [Kribbella sp. VKM Ac-2500]TCO31486.1 hypothetical protein EV644_101126 [Kribbella orskensis]